MGGPFLSLSRPTFPWYSEINAEATFRGKIKEVRVEKDENADPYFASETWGMPWNYGSFVEFGTVPLSAAYGGLSGGGIIFSAPAFPRADGFENLYVRRSFPFFDPEDPEDETEYQYVSYGIFTPRHNWYWRVNYSDNLQSAFTIERVNCIRGRPLLVKPHSLTPFASSVFFNWYDNQILDISDDTEPFASVTALMTNKPSFFP